MKKLALLFGALSVISGVAYAKEEAPALTVTYIGQSIEVCSEPIFLDTYFNYRLTRIDSCMMQELILLILL